MLLPLPKVLFTIVTCLCLASVVTGKPSEQSRVIPLCTQMYGPIVDQKRNLFSINEFYVLRLNFNRHRRITLLAVEPKYYYADDHPDWAEPNDFPNLSKTEYDRLVAEVDRIKPKGSLVKRRLPGAAVTNMTAWYRETYRHAVLEWGEVVDLRRAPDAPLLVRWFRLYYSKRAT
jgi:hypothetical protein